MNGDLPAGSSLVSAPSRSGLLALRKGPLLEGAVRPLSRLPEVLFVDATG